MWENLVNCTEARRVRSSRSLSTSRNRAPLPPFQFLATLSMNKFSLISNLDLPWRSLRPFTAHEQERRCPAFLVVWISVKHRGGSEVTGERSTPCSLHEQVSREPRWRWQSDRERQGHRAMAEDKIQRSAGHSSDWFFHDGMEAGELESTTSASLKHVLNSVAAVGQEHRMPLEYKARVQKAGNNNFPFSSHDNRHEICNAVEYFDLGMGVRKMDPEKQRQNSHNFFEWARAPGRSSSEGFVTMYQSSFVSPQSPGNEEHSHRRYPKHHTQNQNQSSTKPAPENDKALQPHKTS